MTSNLVDLSAWDDSHARSMSFRESASPYVLVADTDPQRIEECLASLSPFNIETIVARDGDEAVAILERRGSPKLLIVDLSLPRKDGFAVIGAIPSADRGRVAVIAWSSRRELREFAVHRLAGLEVRVIGGTAAPSVLRGAIEAALPDDGAQKHVADGEPDDSAQVDDTM